MRKHISLAAAAVTAAVFLATGSAAVAAPPQSEPVTLADGLVGPLHASAGRDGSVHGQRVIRRPADAGSTRTAPSRSSIRTPHGMSPVAANAAGPPILPRARAPVPLMPAPLPVTSGPSQEDGTQRTFGDFAALETEENADGGEHYGFKDLPDACAGTTAARGAGCVHRRASTPTRTASPSPADTIYVADAGANSVVSVDIRSGETETVAVLPPQPYRITAEVASTLQLPDCVVGRTYAFEPVPTDVAVGPDGWLYVSVLPGGPEDPALGARGAVYRVNPDNGRVRLFADEVMSPTGLALDDDGDVYVASLFGEGVLRIDGDEQAEG